MNEDLAKSVLPLPHWVKSDIDESNDPKVTVSLKWLLAVLEKADMGVPAGLVESAR